MKQEVLSLYLFSFLDPRSLCRSSRVCSRWKCLTESDQLWMPKCLRLGWYLPFTPGPYATGVWKRNYIENIKSLQVLRPRHFSRMDNRPLGYHVPSDGTDDTCEENMMATANTEELFSMAIPEEAASSQTHIPMTPISTGMNFANGYSLVDAFDSGRYIKACYCLNAVCHQNLADDEDFNTPDRLILVMDAFGYSAEEIRFRKQFSSFNDIFKKIFAPNKSFITGSTAQGFSDSLYALSLLSDTDLVNINSTIRVITNQEYLQYKQNPFLCYHKNDTQAVLRVEDDQKFPGYVKLLRVLPVGIVFPSTKQYFSSYEYRVRQQVAFSMNKPVWKGTDGPAQSMYFLTGEPGCYATFKADVVECLEYKTWPNVVQKWAERSRPNDWPSKDIIQRIKQKGCYLAPVGHFDSESKDLQWRLSFCGEDKLLSELKPVQFYCLMALRLILKDDISRINENVLSSFHMKNVVFWCAERSSCAWTISNFENCLQACIEALAKFVSSGKFPYYFIVGRNLFNSKMTSDLSSKILKLLQKYRNNIYQIMSLDCLSFLKSSTLYKRPALELAVQKSVIYACIAIYGQTVANVMVCQLRIWNSFTSLDVLECLQKANQTNHTLKFEKQHYLRHHILGSYIHSILGFLNYACYKTFGQNEYLPAARKHVVKSMTFSNIALKCRAATFFFMESDFEKCLKICTAFINYPVKQQLQPRQVFFQKSWKSDQDIFDLIDESDITLLDVRKKQLMSMFFCTGGKSCCDFTNSKTSTLSTFKKVTYTIVKDMYLDVIYTRVESEALPEVIQFELYSMLKLSKVYPYSIHGIYLSPFLNCCLLAFLCYHEQRHYESRDKILNKIVEHFIECKHRTDGHNINTIINIHHEPVYQIANIAVYCHLKLKHYRSASKFILESLTHFPSKRNAAYGYLRCVVQSLSNILA